MDTDETKPAGIVSLIVFGFGLAIVILACLLRTNVRASKNIAGTMFSDFLASMCCTLCTICQMSTEAGLGEEPFNLCNYPEPETV